MSSKGDWITLARNSHITQRHEGWRGLARLESSVRLVKSRFARQKIFESELTRKNLIDHLDSL